MLKCSKENIEILTMKIDNETGSTLSDRYFTKQKKIHTLVKCHLKRKHGQENVKCGSLFKVNKSK